MAFCTILRNRNGNWYVPYSNWNGSRFNRNANWLSNDWNSNYRVVLLDTISCFRSSAGKAGLSGSCLLVGLILPAV